MKSRPTVIDVAAAADVGASTVSRFLRGVPVRPEFAERISRAVNNLGYPPNQTARSLRAGRSRTVGVLFPRVSTVYFSQALQCVEILARQRDYLVALLTHSDKLALQQQCLQTLRSCHAEGIILSAAPGTTLDLIHATPRLSLWITSFLRRSIRSCCRTGNPRAMRRSTCFGMDTSRFCASGQGPMCFRISKGSQGIQTL